MDNRVIEHEAAQSFLLLVISFVIIFSFCEHYHFSIHFSGIISNGHVSTECQPKAIFSQQLASVFDAMLV